MGAYSVMGEIWGVRPQIKNKKMGANGKKFSLIVVQTTKGY